MIRNKLVSLLKNGLGIKEINVYEDLNFDLRVAAVCAQNDGTTITNEKLEEVLRKFIFTLAMPDNATDSDYDDLAIAILLMGEAGMDISLEKEWFSEAFMTTEQRVEHKKRVSELFSALIKVADNPSGVGFIPGVTPLPTDADALLDFLDERTRNAIGRLDTLIASANSLIARAAEAKTVTDSDREKVLEDINIYLYPLGIISANLDDGIIRLERAKIAWGNIRNAFHDDANDLSGVVVTSLDHKANPVNQNANILEIERERIRRVGKAHTEGEIIKVDVFLERVSATDIDERDLPILLSEVNAYLLFQPGYEKATDLIGAKANLERIRASWVQILETYEG